ncbi:MAG: BlaI/MecI/CopY family transcriptional regulator [Acidobacteriota bacterium]|jgi:predicted transcriptional regulator
MRRKSPILTEQELEIMKVVWEFGTATVRDVYETLLTRRKIAYTTVMTMMKIMEDKKYLKRQLEGRAYVYEGTRPKKQMIREMVSEFINRVFNGSAEPLVAHLVEERRLSDKELKQITKMVRENQ